MPEQESKREVLRDKVVDLVKEFVEINGGMKICDIDYAMEQTIAALHTNQTMVFVGPKT